MWTLIFYISVGFGTGATGGPAVIENFRSEEACIKASKQLKSEYSTRYDDGRCFKIEK